jgi:F-type H+-transporting ATPase subunit delta
VKRVPGGLARRYARALLEVAEAGGKDKALALKQELRSFAREIEAHAPLKRALAHPSLAAEKKRNIVAALAEHAQATPLVKRLVEVLAIRDRLALFPQVAAAYADLANAAHGVVMAEVVSAAPLEPAQTTALEAVLRARGTSVELAGVVDPALLGGLVLRLGGRTYDGSVRTRLAALKRRLATSG